MAEGPDREEKTEEATPRRIDEAREKGQVAMSTEAIAAAGLLAAAAGLMVSGGRLTGTLGGLVARGGESLAELGPQTLSRDDFAELLRGTVERALPPLLLIVLPFLAVVSLAGFLQVGLRITPKAVAFDPNKLNPISGVQKLFSLRSVVRTLFAASKMAAVMVVVVAVSWRSLLRLGAHAGDDVGPTLAAIGRVLLRASLAAILALLALALFDVWFQRFQFRRDIRMSKKEVKEEHKASEGDPLVRSRIRTLQREQSVRRMMADVPEATVVVTNPTHFAVALRYEPDGQGAPRVVAKGVDEVAENIKRVAREAGVLVVEDAPLARALHRTCAIGDEVPEDLFGAVASVLAYVYRIQGSPVGA